MTRWTDDAVELIDGLRQLAMLRAECGTSWSEDTTEWKAADLLASYRTLAQAAGYSDVGEALKAIPVKDAALAPFVKALADGGDYPCDADDDDASDLPTPTYGDFRRARQALANGGTA
jgi:hypothetical protein